MKEKGQQDCAPDSRLCCWGAGGSLSSLRMQEEEQNPGVGLLLSGTLADGRPEEECW